MTFCCQINWIIQYFQRSLKLPSTAKPSSGRCPTWATSSPRWTTSRRPSRSTRSSWRSPNKYKTKSWKPVHLVLWVFVTDFWKDLTSHWVFTHRYDIFQHWILKPSPRYISLFEDKRETWFKPPRWFISTIDDLWLGITLTPDIRLHSYWSQSCLSKLEKWFTPL